MNIFFYKSRWMNIENMKLEVLADSAGRAVGSVVNTVKYIFGNLKNVKIADSVQHRAARCFLGVQKFPPLQLFSVIWAGFLSR